MKIKLFLKNINQEMIDAGRKVSAKKLKKAGIDSWVVSWPKSCCVLDFSIVNPRDRIINPLRGFVLRAEKDGGMMWDPRAGSVYKLDEEAYHTLLELDRGYSMREVANRMNIPLKSVKSLTNKILRVYRAKKAIKK